MKDILYDSDRLRLDGKIEKHLIEMEDLAKMDSDLSRAYAYSNACTKDVQEYLNPIIGMASDMFCEICREKGIDPLTADFASYS